MGQTGWRLNAVMKSIGVTWDRIDVGDGSNVTEVQYAASQGVKALVLYNPGLGGRSPSQVASEVKSLAQRILPLGLSEIEFGNEVYYDGQTTPQSYAAQYAAAHAAVAGMGVTLIANSYGDYQRSDGTWSQDSQRGGWIHDFLAALRARGTRVDAFSIHPYGSLKRLTSGEDDGWLEVPRYHALALASGADVPWYVTEVGQCLGGKACDLKTDLSGQQAAVSEYLNDLVTKYTWVKFWCWYEIRDDGAGDWGLLNSDNTTRPGFKALAEWMRSHQA